MDIMYNQNKTYKLLRVSLLTLFILLNIIHLANGQGKFTQLKLIQKSGKWGLSTRGSAGKMILPAEYDKIDMYGKEGQWLLEKDKKMGIADSNGKILIPVKFDFLGKIHNGVSLVKEGSKYGYINKDGIEVFPIIYDKATEFYDPQKNKDLQQVIVMKDGKYGILDASGKTVLEPTIEEMGTLSDGLILTKMDGKYGYMSGDAKWIIEPTFVKADPFNEGLAFIYDEAGKKGLIDKTGKKIADSKYDDLGEISEGVLAINEGGLWGFADVEGNIITAPQYLEAHKFMGGYAVVKFKEKAWNEKGDKNDPNYKEFSKTDMQKEGYGYIGKNGAVFLPPYFSKANDFKNGIAIVTLKNGKLGYINRLGRFSK